MNSSLPTSYLILPSDINTITITDILPTDLDQDSHLPFQLSIHHRDNTTTTLLTLTLTPTPEGTVQVTDLRPLILDYIDSITPTATGIPTNHFLTIQLHYGQTTTEYLLLLARHPLTIPTDSLFHIFLTPSAPHTRPLPPTAQYEPLHLLDTTDSETSTAPTATVTALWRGGLTVRRTTQTLQAVTLQTAEYTPDDPTNPDAVAYYRLSTLNAAPTLLTPPTTTDTTPTDTTTEAPYQLISYDIQCGPRRQSYRIIPPSLTLTSDGPRPILYANTFYLPEVIYFYGSTTHTHKPTYTALRTDRALTINYERTLVPTFTLHTGPLLPSTLAQLPDLIISPRPYLLLSPDGSSLAPITLTEASHAPTTIPTDLQTASITYRLPDDTFSLSIATTLRTFDPTFDTTFY